MQKFKKRVREISLKYSSLSGQVASKKVKQEIQFESSLERDLIYLLEFDIEVSEYLEQPVTIKYMDECGKMRSYTPDFIISYHNIFKKTELVEVKYEGHLIKYQSELALKFKAAQDYCEERNLIFKVYTEKYIRDENEAFLNNAKFLSGYKFRFDNFSENHPKYMDVRNQGEKILNTLEILKVVVIKDLLDFLSARDLLKRAEIMFLIWYLISQNFISTDLKKPLNMRSKIWVD